jgi:hypothetical protein
LQEIPLILLILLQKSNVSGFDPGCPDFLLLNQAASVPSFVRSDIRRPQNGQWAPKTWNTSFPAAEEVSMDFFFNPNTIKDHFPIEL